MPTEKKSGGFALYEIMISITIVGILSDLLSISLFPLLERAELANTADFFPKYSITGTVDGTNAA